MHSRDGRYRHTVDTYTHIKNHDNSSWIRRRNVQTGTYDFTTNAKVRENNVSLDSLVYLDIGRVMW